MIFFFANLTSFNLTSVICLEERELDSSCRQRTRVIIAAKRISVHVWHSKGSHWCTAFSSNNRSPSVFIFPPDCMVLIIQPSARFVSDTQRCVCVARLPSSKSGSGAPAAQTGDSHNFRKWQDTLMGHPLVVCELVQHLLFVLIQRLFSRHKDLLHDNTRLF